MGIYGPRDAACVLMGRGHKVSARWDGPGAPPPAVFPAPGWVFHLDGQPSSWRELEDRAETYERLAWRVTSRHVGPLIRSTDPAALEGPCKANRPGCTQLGPFLPFYRGHVCRSCLALDQRDIGNHVRPGWWPPPRGLRSASVVTDLHRLLVPVKAGNQGVSIRTGMAFFASPVRGGGPGGTPGMGDIRGSVTPLRAGPRRQQNRFPGRIF